MYDQHKRSEMGLSKIEGDQMKINTTQHPETNPGTKEGSQLENW